MTTPKSAPTAANTGNVELFKTANAQVSFICEAMLDFKGPDGKTYDKIVLVLVKRTADNKAEATVRFFLDVPHAKVLFTDIFSGKLEDDYSEFKQAPSGQRALDIKPLESGDYRFGIRNKTVFRNPDSSLKSKAQGDSEFVSLFFDLTRFDARCVAKTVLDYLRDYQLGTIIADRIYARKSA